MNAAVTESTYRVLVIDDNPAIHDDFRKILCTHRGSSSQLDATGAFLFDESPDLQHQNHFEIHSAYQGQEGLARVHHAMQQEGRPYDMAFVDVRMPPGWDGIEVTPRLWQADPALPIVICTAYSDYSWEEMFVKLGASDRLFVLQKPFARAEVLQLAHTLPRKRHSQPKNGLKNFEDAIQSRTRSLEEMSRKLQAEISALKRLGSGLS